MTQNETGRIMAVIRAYYPGYYRAQTKDEVKAAVEAWAAALADYDYSLVSAAVQALVPTLRYPPSVADVVEAIHRLTDAPADRMSDVEAWAIVRRAICSSTYHSAEEFTALPDNIKAVVHSSETLRDWAMASEDDLDTVIASNFQRSYRYQRSENAKMNAIPSSARLLIEEWRERQGLAIEG